MDGLISVDTFEHRVAVAGGARTESELLDLVADLVLRPFRTTGAIGIRAKRMRELFGRTAGLPGEVIWRVGAVLPRPYEGPLVIGRDPKCHLVLRDPSVSRHHLEVRADLEGWLARDLGSRNGSWLGPARLGRARIDPGDEILLGDTVVVFT